MYNGKINPFLAGFLLVGILSCSNPAPETNETPQEESTANGYDSAMAAAYEADQYGMHSYVMAFLKAGPNRSQSPEEAAEIQRAHLNNINRLAEEGKLVLAGPFMDTGEVRGIYVFAVESVDEARKLTETDPAIQAGRLVMELKPWYGSAALMGLNEVHKKISRENP